MDAVLEFLYYALAWAAAFMILLMATVAGAGKVHRPPPRKRTPRPSPTYRVIYGKEKV